MNKMPPDVIPTAARFYLTHSAEEVERVCAAAGTTIKYFRQIMYGHRTPSSRLAKSLEELSANEISASELLFSPPEPGSVRLPALRRSMNASS